MSASCNACNKLVKASEKIRCSVESCGRYYHLACVNVTTRKVRQTGWICPSCLTSIPKGDNTNTPIRQQHPEASPSDSHNSQPYVTRKITERDGDNTLLKDELMSMMRSELPRMVREAVKDAMESIRTDIQDLQNSLTYIHAEYTELRKGYEDLRTDNKALTKTCQELEFRIADIERETAKQQQWSRLQNLELIGVPETKDESLIEIATKVADRAGVSLRPDEIDFAHRVKPRREVSGRPRSIVLRFKQRLTKDKLLSAARRCQGISTSGIGMSGENRRIFVNEHLTLTNKMLLKDCKDYAKENNYKYVWTKNCRIYLRKHEKSPPILVSTKSDLKKVTQSP